MDVNPWVLRLRTLVRKFDGLPTHHDNHHNTYYDDGPYMVWKTQARVALVSLLGEGHAYIHHFDELHGVSLADGHGPRALVYAVMKDLEDGHLFQSLKGLVTSEVFNDFLEMAGHLLEQGYKDAAASVIGAVLEDGLRRIAFQAGTDGRGLGKLDDACLKAAAYNNLVHQQATVWIATRNKAAHGEFSAYDVTHVQEMHRGVTQFLGYYLH